MKNIIRLILLLVFFFVGKSIFAQEIKVKDTIHKVEKAMTIKGSVANTSTPEKKASTFKALDEKKLEVKEDEKIEKQLEKAEKARKKAEKKQKKAEKILKQKEKAQTNFEKATKKYEEALSKYEKLKTKGKLSPVDEVKWLEKIEKLNTNIIKAKKKFK